MWTISLLVVALALQVLSAHGSALRARLQKETHPELRLLSVANSAFRAAGSKTMPPFDINPGTFLSFVSALPTDSLLLFFSPQCGDCVKLAPQWNRFSTLFENNQDLAIISVSDDEGKAPAPYVHDENPAIFFIPKGDAAHPIPFPMSGIHEFVALPETGQTDDDIVNKLVTFTQSHLTSGPSAASPLPPAPTTAATPPSAMTEEQSGALTARLLASLSAKAGASLEEQLKIVNEPHYQSLPVVEFLLKSPSGSVLPPLVQAAAKYLDGLPMAKQWAEQYAVQQESIHRSNGWSPMPQEEKSYHQDLLNYAIPMYAKSIYFQSGLKL